MPRGKRFRRRLVRLLSEPLERIGSWVSARYPFVWFTRLPLWAGSGLLATLVAALWARAMSVRPGDLPGLESMVVMLSSWTFVVYALLLVLAVDLVRRGPVFLPGGHSLRLAGCVFVSTVCLLLPQYAFLRIALPRIAGVETHQQVEATLARHDSYRSWHCGYEEELAFLLEMHRGEIERDLQQWGFPTNVAVVKGCRDSSTYRPYSLQMPANGVTGSSTPSSRESIIDLDATTGLDTFHERLLTVDAAQHYVRGEIGAFETTRTPTMAHELLGNYAVGPPITSRLFQMPLVGLLMAVPIGFIVATRFYRIRAMKASRAWVSAIRVQPAAMSHAEEWLASHLPTVWASRLHASMPQLVALVALGALLAGQLVTGTLLWIATPAAIVVTGFITLRAQENARQLTSGRWQPVGVFLLHWVTIGLCATVIAWLFDMTRGASLENILAVMWLTLLVSMMLQLARFSSALLAYLTMIVAIAVAGTAIFLAERLRTAQLTSLSNDMELVLILAVFVGLCGLAVYLTARFDTRIVVRRLVVGVFLLLAAFTGTLFFIISLANKASDITPPRMVAISILFAIVVAVALRLTADHRRVLALSGR